MTPEELATLRAGCKVRATWPSTVVIGLLDHIQVLYDNDHVHNCCTANCPRCAEIMGEEDE